MGEAGIAAPAFVAQYLPKGHRLFFAETQGALRHDWLLCVCGLGIKLDKVPGPLVDGKPTTVTETLTEARWLEAVNQCRLAVHSTKVPCPPVTLDGTEQLVREGPPIPPAPIPAVPVAVGLAKKKLGRPKKEFVHAV